MLRDLFLSTNYTAAVAFPSAAWLELGFELGRVRVGVRVGLGLGVGSVLK